MPIQIISRKEGFRRCGVQHSASPTVYPDDRFTEEEVKRLKAEPMLIVVELPAAATMERDPSPPAARGRKDF